MRSVATNRAHRAVRHMEQCGDPHAAWLSHEIAKVLRGWDEEADGVIGAATG